MVRTILLSAAILVTCALGAMVWQHARYLHARREIVGDRQALLHSAEALHVVTFLELRPGSDLIEELRKLRAEVESGGEARMVYAGKVALTGQASSQLGAIFGPDVAWDAVIAVQYPSREAWDRVAASEGHRHAMARFERTYAHGMERWLWTNLAIPQILLARRARQIATREPSHFPFVPAQGDAVNAQRQTLAARLRSERELGGRGAVVVNLVQRGTAEQQAADSAYTGAMFGLMAEGGHGPMHLGRAVTLEHGTQFDAVALVYYPGVDYFADMVTSTFYQRIFGQKQLGDTQASITVPILDRL